MEAMVSKAEYDELKAKYEALRHELDQLKRLILGSKQERFVPTQQPEQLSLELGEQVPAQSAVETTETITYQRRKKAHPGRTALPDNIPTEEIIIEPEADTTRMKLIGQKVTETVDYRPGVLLKRRYIRPKYARAEQMDGQLNVIIGELPERPIPKGIAEAGLLAHLIVAKYVDHLPFYVSAQPTPSCVLQLLLRTLVPKSIEKFLVHTVGQPFDGLGSNLVGSYLT
jgi:transposase